jgi:hypothetical protein
MLRATRRAIDIPRRKARLQIDLPQARRLRSIPKLAGICGANLESLQNAAFPFATGA